VLVTVPTARPPSGEEGVAMVTVAIWLPLLILLASFAIDFGNWLVHDRHLQLQADAGALAAAGDFRYPCDDAAIESRAREYSGSDAGAGYNHQVGGTPQDDVHFALNSKSYPEQPSKQDPTVVAAPPCEAGMVDVKLTETDLPLFLRVAGLFASVPFVNAHARVQVFEKLSNAGGLPVAVPDTNPRKARVTFVDEASGEALASAALTRDGSSGELAIWDNEAEPLPLTVDRERIGMRIALSGGGSTTCGDPLVECYDAESPGGILYVRGYSLAGSGAQPGPPLARNAYLLPGSCDPYFSSEEEGCSVGLHAEVDFGPCAEIGEVGAELTAVAGGSKYAMERVGCPEGSSTSVWETSGAPIPVPVGAGPVPVALEWAETKGEQGGEECKEGGGNKCAGDFGAVQRSFAGSNERSGPVRLAQVWEGGAAWANSFERCSAVQESCAHALVVRIGIDQTLLENAQSAEEPPVDLRVFHEAENNPSQNQALNCEDGPNLREEIAFGCAPRYATNQGTACPSPAALWESPEPWECVAVEPGGTVNQVFFGMSERVHGNAGPAECVSPSDWASFPDLNPSDPRLVPVFLTPFGSFAGSGAAETVPVTDFAIFYVTGWAGQGEGKSSSEICPGGEGAEGDDPAETATIVGHFVKYVQSLNDGSAGEETCDFASPTPCVAVLTE
jgi:hypothetical protein